MMLIGLCGYIGSGKDTCANILQCNHQFERFAFASPIKDICSLLFGWNREALEGSTPSTRIWRETIDPWWTEQLGVTVTPRRMLQLIGTDMFRDKLSPLFWTAVIKNQIKSSYASRIVVTDCRFPEEIEMIRSLGGIIVKVDRGNASLSSTSHISEQYISSVVPDATIDNTKDIDHLRTQLTTLLHFMNEEHDHQNVFSKNQN